MDLGQSPQRGPVAGGEKPPEAERLFALSQSESPKLFGDLFLRNKKSSTFGGHGPLHPPLCIIIDDHKDW